MCFLHMFERFIKLENLIQLHWWQGMFHLGEHSTDRIPDSYLICIKPIEWDKCQWKHGSPAPSWEAYTRVPQSNGSNLQPWWSSTPQGFPHNPPFLHCPSQSHTPAYHCVKFTYTLWPHGDPWVSDYIWLEGHSLQRLWFHLCRHCNEPCAGETEAVCKEVETLIGMDGNGQKRAL